MLHIILYTFHHSVLVFQVILKTSARISNQQQTQQPPDLQQCLTNSFQAFTKAGIKNFTKFQTNYLQ